MKHVSYIRLEWGSEGVGVESNTNHQGWRYPEQEQSSPLIGVMLLMAFYEKLKKRARSLKMEIGVLFLALRDPRTPWYAKGLAVVIVGYALSPIDLIPDFVPVLGYLDDLLLLPLGIYLTMKLIPQEVLIECRRKSAENPIKGPFRKSWIAGGGVVLIWLLLGWIMYCYIR